MPAVYREPARDVPVMGEFDVVVAGGGPAGCAAAIAAARHGARALLVEEDGYLGGTTVDGLVVPILSTNGVDFQGVWHELMHKLKGRNGVAGLAPRRGFSYMLVGSVDPEMVKLAWDELATDAGVVLLHHALVAGAMVGEGGVGGVLAETRAGRRAILARRVVDCTGDGAVCAAAGVPWEQGADGRKWAMAVTKVFRWGGVPLPKEIRPGQGIPGFGRSIDHRAGEAMGFNRILRIDPLDPWDLTRAEREGRAIAWNALDAKRKKPGGEHLRLVDPSHRIGVRSSRRIHGIATATRDDAWNFRKHPDGIARSSWDIDIHSPEVPNLPAVPRDSPAYKPRIERMQRGDYFDIRYGCIVARGVDNLLVAGRCLSAEHEAQASLRIQQTCMATGQAAGTAAALSLRQGVPPRELDPSALVAQLARDRAAVEPAFEELKDLPIVPRPGDTG